MTYEEFWKLPTIKSYFPLNYASGNNWVSFKVKCHQCGKFVSNHRTRGVVTSLFNGNYRKVNIDYEVVAHGLCHACDVITTAKYILHEDMTMSGRDPDTGKMNRWKARQEDKTSVLFMKPQKLMWWKKLLKWFGIK